ncbi:Hypothetical protein CAP_5435 [Chondromyces apiculatus DSM 436]|uniref:Uncharacterized protein n=1 Tax=Chondromyces apiculatus DSM 436 TaxID=1192034 RepID=A0A017T329_9BACT|nr:Hypothetical protein CAP_5435 [Chondromyces apiculatus DSM 436]
MKAKALLQARASAASPHPRTEHRRSAAGAPPKRNALRAGASVTVENDRVPWTWCPAPASARAAAHAPGIQATKKPRAGASQPVDVPYRQERGRTRA